MQTGLKGRFLHISMKKGFTLLEILVVFAIVSLLAIAGFAGYMNSIKAGRDARRKADVQAIQKALELYYQDNEAFPLPAGTSIPSLPATGTSFCHPNGCNVANYLQVIPTDPGGSTPYRYASNGSSYQIYSCVENVNDGGANVKQTGYGVSCGVGRCNPCRFGLSSTNSSP